MIEDIHIKNVATYRIPPERLTPLSQINFIYGSNGTGKTSIARVIADVTAYPDCKLTWRGGIQLETLVYNRDFIEKNFNQPDELKGIFTLGEKDKNTLAKIQAAKKELDAFTESIATLRKTLDGEDNTDGKITELEELESEFEAKCWALKQKHDEKLQGAFTGFRGKKRDFKAKLLDEAASNSSSAVPLKDLEKKAETIFNGYPEAVPRLMLPDFQALLAHESDQILKKRVVGKSDVDIAAMIQKLGNSDWVKQGRAYFSANDDICPFCQQEAPASLEQCLNEYFDETFETDTATIEVLCANYTSDSERIQHDLQSLLDNPSKFLDAEKLQADVNALDSEINLNVQRIEEKHREPSKAIELASLKKSHEAIKGLLDSANTAIEAHNKMVSNLNTERTELKGQVWKHLLDNEIKADLAAYNTKKCNLEKAITALKKQITDKTEEKRKIELEIRLLEKDTTSIQPTIDRINALLRSFGFSGFALAKSDREPYYKIQRPDGSDAKESLSEGERSFITFLYFYHLLKGSESESGMTSDRIVVFDDPVSSLDSDILFIVSNLIKGLFDEVRSESGTIKQIFILTHNVYFHKEISFNPRRSADRKLREETFWTVRKANQQSKIRRHDANPIQTSYELLWNEVKNPDRDNLSIQNTLRRIIENYFKILGNVDPDEICEKFDTKEKLICKSLFSWVNDGSHFAHDSLYVSIDDSMVDCYLKVFERIFQKTGHEAHYRMMMGDAANEAGAKTVLVASI